MSFARKSAIMIGAAFMSCGANAASLTGSSPGFHYFYKQGATMEAHDAALIDCAVRTRALINGGNNMTDALGTSAGAAGGFAGGFLGALVGGVIDNYENRQGAAANMEGCMAIKGWSVIGVSDDEGEAMKSPDDPSTIYAKLIPLVTAPSSTGSLLRHPFANELAAGNFKIDKAHDLEETSLSVRAVRDRIDTALDAAGELKRAKPDLPKGVKAPKRIKAMESEGLAVADPAKSYIVMRRTGDSGVVKSTALSLQRLALDGTEVVYDGAAILAVLDRGATSKGKSAAGSWLDHVLEVPPGRWKLSEIAYAQFGADLCFGAPSFEVKPGETIYLGEMTMPVTGGYPFTSDLAAAKEILAANPLLAEKVKAAEWTNGFTSDCFGSYAYAYEIPGAPFVDMNALARATAAADAAPPVEMPVEEEANSDTNSLEGGGEQ